MSNDNMGPKGWNRLRKREAKFLARHLRSDHEIKYVDSMQCPADGQLIVAIEINYNHKVWFGIGRATCNKIDKWNEDIGVEIATGRALLRIAYQILREKDKEADQRVENFLSNGLEGFDPYDKFIANAAKSLGISHIVFPNTTTDQIVSETVKKDIHGTKTFRGDDEYYGIKPEKPIDAIAKMHELGMMEKDDDRDSETEG